MAGTALHIVFTPSGAGALRDALKEAGQDDQVISLMDCLSFGPINPPDGELRRAWVEEELGYTDWEEVVIESTFFWSQALSVGDRKIAWLSRRSAQEYAGFLELLWRLGDEPFEFVDLTDVMVAEHEDGKPTTPRLAISLATLFPYQILESGLLHRAEEMPSVLRDQYRDLGGVSVPKMRRSAFSVTIRSHPRRSHSLTPSSCLM
jgi:hypothetical protein